MVSARRSGQRRAAQCVRSRRSGIAGAPGEAAVGGGSETVAVADACGPSLGETSRRHRETGPSQSPPVTLVGLDTGVFVAGVFWRHEPHACVEAWFRGLICPVVSEAIFVEYERVLREVKAQEKFDTEIEPWLDAVRSSAAWVTPVKLREQVCRDRDDDKFIEAALAAGARTLIARDADLTILRKPFGIEVLTPRQWLSRLPRAQRRQLR